MPFTLYNKEDTQKILAASNITPLKTVITKDKTGDFDVYFHPHPIKSQPHNFLRDLIEYILIKRDRAGNRRVAFLNNDFALIVECGGIDFGRAEKVLHHIKIYQLNTVEAVLIHAKKDPAFQNNLQQLYSQINAIFLTIKKPGTIVSRMGEILRKTYLLPTPVIPTVHVIEDPTGANFIKHLQMQLLQGYIASNRSDDCTAPLHRFLLTNWLEQLHVSDATIWLAITNCLEIILKFQRLQNERQALDSGYQTSDADEVLLKDKQYKLVNFNNSLDKLQNDLSTLPINFLADILSFREAPDEILTMLQAYKKDLQEQIVAWEKSWQQYSKEHAQPWSQWLTKKLIKTGQYIYDNSFMALGSNLLSWGARHASTYIPWQSPLVKSSRNFIGLSVKLTVFFTTLSPQLANRASTASKELLTEDGLIDLAKTLGNTLGAISNTSLGGYYFLRAVLMASGTQQLREYLKAEKIELETATISSNDEKLPNIINLLRINYLILALINGISANEPRFVIQAISGMTGSIAYERLGNFVIGEFSDNLPFTLSLEDRRYIQFFLSLFGMEAGNALSNTYFNIIDNLANDEAALLRFKELVMKGTDVYEFQANTTGFSDLLWSLIAEKRGVTLFWKDSSGRHESTCQMSIDGLAHMASIDCESPIMPDRGIASL